MLTTAVVKRNGKTVEFDADRIEKAVSAALSSIGNTDFETARAIKLATMAKFTDAPSVLVEEIQDEVERQLMVFGEFEAAKAFILYRNAKAELRPKEYGDSGISDYIVMSKYSRYREDLGRRELWHEASKRVFDMHRDNFSHLLKKSVTFTDGDDQITMTLASVIDMAESGVTHKDVLPSMRSLQFGGQAILEKNMRIFNCVYGYIDTPRRFAEAMWLLLCGTGVGFSVQKHHVAKLPAFPVRGNEDDLPVVHFRIPDTIEGWADALDALVQSHYNGTYVEFDFSAIRPKGSPLKTSGGKAPGHLALKKALRAIRDVLRATAGRHMRPIEAYDILMYSAGAVVSGGIRRSATIALFSPDDEDMINAKTGEWWKHNPQRQHSNNSAVLLRSNDDRATFDALFGAIRQFGEPGFYFTDSTEYGANPCVEIALNPTIEIDGKIETGWQSCNLTTINGARCTNERTFWALCIEAAVIGTLQAAYTECDYLGPVTKALLEREALLGVSICGILENPQVLLDPDVLCRGAEIVKSTNQALAKVLGTNPAARTTCVKPEGSASLVLNTGSGIHPRHARRYFRRVQAARTEPVFKFFRDLNPQMVEPYLMKADTTDVITFPVVASDTAIVKDDITAIDFLGMVKLVQENWVVPGTAYETYSPGARHNVSNTVTVKPDEWDAVADYIWENRAFFTGVSLLGASGDKDYLQAPNEEVTTDDDVRKWNALNPHPVNYALMFEATDETTLQSELACAGNSCEIV